MERVIAYRLWALVPQVVTDFYLPLRRQDQVIVHSAAVPSVLLEYLAAVARDRVVVRKRSGFDAMLARLATVGLPEMRDSRLTFTPVPGSQVSFTAQCSPSGRRGGLRRVFQATAQRVPNNGSQVVGRFRLPPRQQLVGRLAAAFWVVYAGISVIGVVAEVVQRHFARAATPALLVAFACALLFGALTFVAATYRLSRPDEEALLKLIAQAPVGPLP
jgi:hypothetical protein